MRTTSSSSSPCSPCSPTTWPWWTRRRFLAAAATPERCGVLRDLVIIYHMWSARCSRGCLRARAPRRHVPPRRALSTSAAVDAALGSTTTAASGSNADLTSRRWDAIIVGGGHNGLTTAAYLAKAGKSVLVLERRHVLGGAAVTEEMVPGFHFSRASYLCSLLRPAVIKELELVRHGLRFHPRPHSSFTPLLDGRSLLMGDAATTRAEIAKFSPKDAEAYAVYEAEIEKFADILEAVLDSIPPDPAAPRAGGLKELAEHAATLGTLARHGRSLGGQLGPFIELLTAPASRVLERWFESEPLMSTLATDAVIGAMMSPETPGSGYVLLHHVMGETDGARGVWAYVEGGMGAVSATIAAAAEEAGATLRTHAPVRQIVARDGVGVAGVELLDGTLIESNNVFSNATPHVTLNGLLGKEGQAMLPASVMARLETADYSSGTTKINLAVNSLPQFSCKPPHHGVPQPEHQGTIHLGCESLSQMHEAFADASEHGEYSQLPLIEMTIPSALDPTLAPPGCHVINLFVQYTPYALSGGRDWDTHRQEFCDHVLATIELYAPGFTASVVGKPDILTPPDLERVFGLTGGNIFHGSCSLDRLFIMRPAPGASNYRVPGLPGLYMCGAGAHPGGGVMGAPGRNAARAALRDM